MTTSYLCILISFDGTEDLAKTLTPYILDCAAPVFTEKFLITPSHVQYLRTNETGNNAFAELKAKIKTALACGVTNINCYISKTLKDGQGGANCRTSIIDSLKYIMSQLDLNRAGSRQLSIYEI